MAEQRSDDLLRSRQEAALLLRLDPTNLSPSDVLRCDLVASLRLVVDDASATVLDGRAPDLARLLTATETLIRLLPSEPPKPESQRDDPREVLWNIIKEGRDRLAEGYEGYDGKCRQIEALQGEVAALKAQLVGAGLAPALPDVPMGGFAINPPTSAIVPPSERAECDLGPQRGPDDPKPPVTIDAKAKVVPPAPPAPQNWDDTDSGKAWQAWHDAGGSVGGDRWSNRNE